MKEEGKALVFFLIYVIGSVPLNFFVKDLLEYFSIGFSLFIRFIIMFLFTILFSKKIILNKNIAVLSFFVFLSTTLWLYSLIYLSPADSLVLSYSMPLIASLIGRRILNEKSGEIYGVLVAFLGYIAYSYNLMKGFTLYGTVLSFINAFAWAYYSVLYRKLRTFDVFVLNSSVFLICSLFSLAVLPLYQPIIKAGADDNVFADVIWFATIGGAVQFLSWNRVLSIWSASKATVLSYIVPILTFIIQCFSNKESPSLLQVIGIALITIGVILTFRNELKNHSNSSLSDESISL
ncbi:DMT family transporter [Fervidicoccus fontis]|uniref:DMT family transporter n=1 Tax=Fervidicoccus fontis TaxID=683846 RepID=A0A843A8Z8_9CREN|nr:DMT family transporter [Fervidicoccus fontis]MBE9391333.1 DMT family transporter [Fervidicoccus fontis]